MPVSPAYTSVSFYTRFDVAYYAINDRAAGRRVIELDLMTARSTTRLPEDEEVTAADRLIVEFADADRADRDPRAGAGARPDADGAERGRRSAMREGGTGAASCARARAHEGACEGEVGAILEPSRVAAVILRGSRAHSRARNSG